ncbi:MAG: DEAD/DEAH box helicase [Planctomycetes bacterium]|nr:DEAD/DEAH box helicase [Planctomycetota bacterium]MBU4397974.1 DEAD/DEAH box helicase [Planctomycetota bacterium]MCG2682118.1 DEAD/DEAH box helicase [Planctomycetales bacterium]
MKRMPSFTFEPRLRPYPHQVEAVSFLSERDYAALFDEQGLGKTKIIIDTICQGIATQVIQGALIVCRKSLLGTWEDEVAKHSYLKSIQLRGGPNARGIHFMWFAHFYLVNYEMLISEKERIRDLLQTRAMAMVLDESQRIKNPKSKATEAVHELRAFSRRRYIVTGTPVANTPYDIWAQIYFLDGGATLGKTLQEFIERFSVEKQPHKDRVIKESGLKRLRKALSPFSIRRLKDDVLELPEKRYETMVVDLEPSQRQRYDELREELRLSLVAMDGKTVEDDASNILKRLLRLVQISSNPRLIDTSYTATPAKVQVIRDLVAKILNVQEKVVIWTSFIGNIRMLRKLFHEAGAAMLFGEVPISERDSIVRRFQVSEDLRVIVANPAAAKEGLTLTAANHAVYMDRTFNLADYLQSQDRIHRISQERPAYVYNIVGRDTVDEYIEDVVYRKQMVAQFVCGDHDELRIAEPKYTKEDILRLLGG